MRIQLLLLGGVMAIIVAALPKRSLQLLNQRVSNLPMMDISNLLYL